MDEFDLDTFLRMGKMKELDYSIGYFVRDSPPFDGDCALASKIGALIGQLNGCLKNYWENK